jgi:nucleotide-binding universal stress UspA family protein
MTLIVGYPPDGRSNGALHLGATLARSGDEDLVVCCAVPAPWVPGPARVDAEYREELERAADQALKVAKDNLPSGVRATFVRQSARSAAAGLLDVAEQHDAQMLVLGSSSAGMFGHVALGSVTDRLVHSSPVTLAFAPRGFRAKPGGTVRRVSIAFGGDGHSEPLVLAAATLAAQVGASSRIVSFAVWSRPSYVTRLGTDSEDLVLEEWTEDIRQRASTTREQVEQLAGVSPGEIAIEIGFGRDWGEAIEDVGWDVGDVLVMASSELGPVSRVFLGSRTTQILRHSPVPVIVVPRGRAQELAERATQEVDRGTGAP